MSHRTQLQASTSGHSRLTCPSAATALQRKRSAGFCGRGGARVATASLAPETQQRAVRSPARDSHTHLRGVPMLSCRACAGIETHAAPSCSPSVPLPCCPHRRQLSAPSRHTLSPPQALSPAASAAGVAWPDLVFDVVTVLMVCLYGLLCFAPKARLTSKIVRTGPFIAGLAGLYVITLLANAASGMVAPVLAIFQSIVSDPVNGLSLTAVGNLFLNNGFTALCWVHLLTLDFYMAREIWLNGLAKGVPTAHSVALCFFVGPVGLMSHIVTSYLTHRGQPKGPARKRA